MTNSLYQNIQALGNRMVSNLETMGVSASFNDGGLTLADKILEIQSLTDGVFLFGKNVLQSGNTIGLTALRVSNGELVNDNIELYYTKGSFSNTLTENSNGFTVISGDGFSISSTGAYVNFTDVHCNEYVDLSTDNILVEVQAKCDELGHFAMGIATNNQGQTNSYTSVDIYNNIGFCGSSFSLPTGFDRTEWFDVKVLYTKDEQKLWINDTLIATTTVDYTEEGYGYGNYLLFSDFGGGFTIKNFSVTINTIIASGSHGAVTGSYTGTGAGELTVMAESGSVVSQPISVLDCNIYDSGIDGTATNIYDNTTSGAEIERTSEYTSLKQVTAGTNVVTWISNIPTGSYVDLEYCKVDGSVGDGIFNFNNGGTYLGYVSLSGLGYSNVIIGTWLNLRIKINADSVVVSDLNDSTKTRTIEGNGCNRVRISASTTTSEVRWRNVRVYPSSD